MWDGFICELLNFKINMLIKSTEKGLICVYTFWNLVAAMMANKKNNSAKILRKKNTVRKYHLYGERIAVPLQSNKNQSVYDENDSVLFFGYLLIFTTMS